MDEPNGGVQRADEEIETGGIAEALRPAWWKILLLAFATGCAAALIMLRTPNRYESSGTIAPATEEGKPNVSLGALAASIGLTVGGPTKIEDLEVLFKGRDLTVRVFRKANLWPILFPDGYDPKTGKVKVGWRERLLGGGGETKTPGDWDALRAVEDRLTVSVSRKTGTLSVAFESRSAQGSRDIVMLYLDEGKTRLQERALEKAGRNKAFLESQIARTVDPIIRDRLYTLYSQEVEKEMLARNREQFGFSIADPPLVPDRKSSPRRTRNVVAATLFSLPVWGAVFVFAGKRRRSGRREAQGG